MSGTQEQTPTEPQGSSSGGNFPTSLSLVDAVIRDEEHATAILRSRSVVGASRSAENIEASLDQLTAEDFGKMMRSFSEALPSLDADFIKALDEQFGGSPSKAYRTMIVAGDEMSREIKETLEDIFMRTSAGVVHEQKTKALNRPSYLKACSLFTAMSRVKTGRYPIPVVVYLLSCCSNQHLYSDWI